LETGSNYIGHGILYGTHGKIFNAKTQRTQSNKLKKSIFVEYRLFNRALTAIDVGWVRHAVCAVTHQAVPLGTHRKNAWCCCATLGGSRKKRVSTLRFETKQLKGFAFFAPLR
jgi:hypothetical protein